MPRCVRNFWIELDVDGKKHRIATGPRSAGGGFSMKIFIREEGGVRHAMNITGSVDKEGYLQLRAQEGMEYIQYTAKR